MPELPEVETTRLSVQRALKGKQIAEVLPDTDDHIVFDRASPEQVSKALEGAKVVGTGRKGKYFWLVLDRRPWPVFHLGMTGNIEIRKGEGAFKRAWGGEKLWSDGAKKTREADAAAPKYLPFCKIRIVAQDGTEMAMTDPRRFGRIRLAQDPLSEAPISKLGFDPLLDFPTAKTLAQVLLKRRAPIKAVLLDQGVFAGVGNWIADEVLFQSRVSPHRLASRLAPAEISRLRTKLLSIVERSVSVKADYDQYPASWLFHHRWGKNREAITSTRQPIVHDTVGGRTTAWVPSRQT